MEHLSLSFSSHLVTQMKIGGVQTDEVNELAMVFFMELASALHESVFLQTAKPCQIQLRLEVKRKTQRE